MTKEAMQEIIERCLQPYVHHNPYPDVGDWGEVDDHMRCPICGATATFDDRFYMDAAKRLEDAKNRLEHKPDCYWYGKKLPA